MDWVARFLSPAEAKDFSSSFYIQANSDSISLASRGYWEFFPWGKA
jgi:hypothetical protein